MIPSIEKALSFIALNQSGLKTVSDLHAWVVANQKEPSGRPGLTTKSSGYIVPFYTPNSISCKENFGDEYSLIETGASFDETLGMRLMHGFICAGGWGNNSYSTFLRSDFSETRSEDEQEKINKRIYGSTVGAKLYFFINRKRNSKVPILEDRLVIVVINLRVENGEIICLPIQVRTNSYHVGGHCPGTFHDISYRKYTKQEKWNPSNIWSTDEFREAIDVDYEKGIHDRIHEKLCTILC